MVYKIMVPNPSSLTTTWRQVQGSEDWIADFDGQNVQHKYRVRISTVGVHKMPKAHCQIWFEFALHTRGTTYWADSESTFDNSLNLIIVTVVRIDDAAWSWWRIRFVRNCTLKYTYLLRNKLSNRPKVPDSIRVKRCMNHTTLSCRPGLKKFKRL